MKIHAVTCSGAVLAASIGATYAQVAMPMEAATMPMQPMMAAPVATPPVMEMATPPAMEMGEPPAMEEVPVLEAEPPVMESPPMAVMEAAPELEVPPPLPPAPPMSSAVTGADILNFALNLECLEAEFYSFAAFGTGLTIEQRGGGAPSIGGRKAELSPEVQAIAEEIAADEIAHVEFLRAALGPAAVPCPEMDIGSAFKTAANFAASTILEPRFDPYANDIFFLHAAFIFEDLGVTAYKGAVEPLTALVEASTLSAAAGILAVEAYHAGIIRTLLAGLVADDIDTPFGPVEAVVQLISDLRDRIDGPPNDGLDVDQGIFEGDAINLVPTDTNGLVYGRTVAQTLGVAYLGNVDNGGFFPRGVSGFFGPQGSDMPDPEMMCPGTCTYRMSFNMSWSPASHPIDFPMEPMGFVFPFWTVAHNKQFSMWARGDIANGGIQQIAETGAGEVFLEEVAACGADCGPPVQVPCDPMGGTCSGSGTVTVSPTTPYISTAAMLAPSPDWFTGVNMWDLCDGGEWVESLSRPLPPYDAGTDVGPGFLSMDMPNSSPGRIFSFGMVMPPEASIFYNPDTGSVAPVGQITIERVSCM